MLPSYKKIWGISMPLLIGLLAENIVIAVDTAFLGHVGKTELAASAIAGTFYVVLFVVGMGFGTGTQILIGRRNGEKRFDKIGGIFENSLYFVWLFSAVVVVLSLIFARDILSYVLKSDAILDACIQFLNVRVFSLFFALGCVIMRSFLVGIQHVKYIVSAAFVVAITNFVLDYLLIFGKFGFPQMGLQGAALASVIAESAGFVYFIVIIAIKIDINKYDILKFRLPQLDVALQTMKLSVFTMLQNFLAVSVWFLFFVIIEKTSEQNLAASNIIRSYYILALTPIWAYASAANTLISNAIGAGQSNYVYQIIRRVSVFSLITTVIAVVPILISAKGIMFLYTDDVELIEIGFKSLYVIGIAAILHSIVWIIFSAVSATGNTMIALFLETISIAAYFVAIYTLAANYPTRIEYIWSSEIVYQLFIGALSILYLRTNHWVKKEI
jgi:putative MATE family efflux protein